MVRWKPAWILRVNSASRKNRGVVWYVQEKNCGAIFFTSTITGDVHQDIIQPFVSQLEKSERRSWLQQDNTRPYVSTNTMSFLRKFFISVCFPPTCGPPRSPDLSLLDFFLWGYLKNCVYMTAPQNLKDLKGNIAREIENINQKTLKHVFSNLMKRCRICKANSGGHFLGWSLTWVVKLISVQIWVKF